VAMLAYDINQLVDQRNKNLYEILGIKRDASR